MSMRKEMPPQQGETRLAEAEAAGEYDAHRPRKMTVAENVILTLKVLMGFGVLGTAIWAVDLMTTAK